MERSGASGSAPHTATRCRAYRVGTLGAEWQCDRNAGGRVAVLRTLPLGGERTGQSSVHCHSMSSVPCWNAGGRVAVRLTLPLGGERTGQSSVHCHSGVSVPGSAPYTATRCRAYRVGTLGGEWQCGRNAKTALLASDGVSLFGFALPRAGAARHAPDAQSHSHSVRQLRAQTRERYRDPPTH